jgi:hypothetical protein
MIIGQGIYYTYIPCLFLVYISSNGLENTELLLFNGIKWYNLSILCFVVVTYCKVKTICIAYR